jgi:hypothetical protein
MLGIASLDPTYKGDRSEMLLSEPWRQVVGGCGDRPQQ